MNILVLNSTSDLYGASKILLAAVNLLKKKGHHPIVVLTEDGPLANALQDIGAEVVFIRLGILRRKYKSLAGIINRLWVLRKAYYSIKQLIRERDITLVYSNTTAVLAGAFAAKSLGIRHIWHVQEIIENPKWLRSFLGKLLNNYSDTVIVVSGAVKDNWGKFVSQKKLQLIYSSIDYLPYANSSGKLRKELGFPDETVIIGMIGRVHYWKGQDYFLRIAGRLSHKFPELRFVMIGDAFPGYEYLYETLASIKKEENIGSIVYDLGYRTDVPELLQGFDIMVLPSVLPDPFPTVILEAMASAKPVVATRHGGAKEMIDDGMTGILIPVNDPEEASVLMSPLIMDSEKRRQMGDAGRRKVLSNYSLEAFENKMIKVFE